MRFIPAGVGGVALPVACVAAPARDALGLCTSHARTVSANRRVEPFRNLRPGRWSRRWQPRVRHTRWHGCWRGLCTTGEVAGRRVGRWVGCRFRSKSHCARGLCFPTQKNPALPWSPFGRILIFFNDFCSVEKRVTRSREWHHLLGVNRTSQTHQNTP